jgi:hypothetical protein
VSASIVFGELSEIIDIRKLPSHAKSISANARTVLQNFTSVANQEVSSFIKKKKTFLKMFLKYERFHFLS